MGLFYMELCLVTLCLHSVVQAGGHAQIWRRRLA